MSVAPLAIRKCSSLVDINERSKGLGMRKSVSFSSVADVCKVNHRYPNDFFYTQSETERFRREAREERKCSLSAYIECLTELASSSVVLIVILTLGIVATTIACLPLLLGFKFISLFVADSKDIDSSVVTAGVDSADANSSFAEGLVSKLFGGSCPEDDKRYSRVWELK